MIKLTNREKERRDEEVDDVEELCEELFSVECSVSGVDIGL